MVQQEIYFNDNERGLAKILDDNIRNWLKKVTPKLINYYINIVTFSKTVLINVKLPKAQNEKKPNLSTKNDSKSKKNALIYFNNYKYKQEKKCDSLPSKGTFTTILHFFYYWL